MLDRFIHHEEVSKHPLRIPGGGQAMTPEQVRELRRKYAENYLTLLMLLPEEQQEERESAAPTPAPKKLGQEAGRAPPCAGGPERSCGA
jgi:hypothetical protein